MFLNEHQNESGEYPFFFNSGIEKLEAVLTIPPHVNFPYLALLGHPHSLQGGTMNNKVVTTLVRAFKELGIRSIRFNFRGVGASSGQFDAGIGESVDMINLKNLCRDQEPSCQFLFAGFSFGSYVAYRAAAQSSSTLLITVAPPVHHFNYNEFSTLPSPWYILQGDEDDIVPLSLITTFISQHSSIFLEQFDATGHFFHGKLLTLKSKVMAIVSKEVLPHEHDRSI